jgi:hypothetical protein
VGLEQRLQQLKKDIEKYEDKWLSLMQRNPQLKKDKEYLEAAQTAYKEKKDEADKKLSFFNNVQKNVENLIKQRDKATKEQTNYTEKAANILAKSQEEVNQTETRLAEANALHPTILQQQEEKHNALNQAIGEWLQAEDALKQLQTDYNNELQGNDPDTVEQQLKNSKKKADDAVSHKNEELTKHKTSLGVMIGALNTKKDQLEKEKQNRKNIINNESQENINNENNIIVDNNNIIHLDNENTVLIQKEKEENAKINSTLENMCIIGDITKKEIQEEKKNNPEKFIETSEALNLKG